MIWLLSTIIFVASSTTLSFLLCLIFGHLTSLISILSLALGFTLGAVTFLKFKSKTPKLEKLSYFDWAMVIFFVIFCFRHFLWLIFQVGNSIMALDSNNWGELPKHIAYTAYLGRGAHFWPEHPLLTGAPFTYHFGIDLFSAMFSNLGISFVNYLPVMGFVRNSSHCGSPKLGAGICTWGVPLCGWWPRIQLFLYPRIKRLPSR